MQNNTVFRLDICLDTPHDAVTDNFDTATRKLFGEPKTCSIKEVYGNGKACHYPIPDGDAPIIAYDCDHCQTTHYVLRVMEVLADSTVFHFGQKIREGNNRWLSYASIREFDYAGYREFFNLSEDRDNDYECILRDFGMYKHYVDHIDAAYPESIINDAVHSPQGVDPLVHILHVCEKNDTANALINHSKQLIASLL